MGALGRLVWCHRTRPGVAHGSHIEEGKGRVLLESWVQAGAR